MAVLGINLGETRSGKRLKDGSACIIDDSGVVSVAIAEERVTRQKHAGGFRSALEYSLAASGIELAEFEAIVVSSCCEDVCPRDIEGLDASIKDNLLHYVPSHHLSHAYSAFHVSPFDRALIVVMDAGGNVIGEQVHREWWMCRREQNSYYVGEGNSIRLIDRDFDEPFDAGFGESYRAFTYYLGWHSHVYSANTMALAAYGDPSRYASVSLFDFVDGKIRSRMRNQPQAPIAMVKRWADQEGLEVPLPREPSVPISSDYQDLAAFIQSELEDALVAKVNYLVRCTGIRQLCIAGGVGLNCVANSRILEDTPVEQLFVQPAAGDQGQGLGNALYGYHRLLAQPREYIMTNACLGREYIISNSDITTLTAGINVRVDRSGNIASDVARLLSRGLIVGWFQGRSEYGPRALGNRSILADPRQLQSKVILNERVKHHGWFRPYAPSVLEGYAENYFAVTQPCPFMLRVARAKPDKVGLIPAVVHVDGTSRLQTVSRAQNPRYYDLIDAFRNITGLPLVLNTSMNARGEPIVETPEDAVKCFINCQLDALAIDDYLILSSDISANSQEEFNHE